MDFKPGDRVVITEGGEEVYKNFAWSSPEMDIYIGRILTLKCRSEWARSGWIVEECEWVFDENHFELVDELENKFEEGDEVIILPGRGKYSDVSWYSDMDKYIGKTLTLRRRWGGYYHIWCVAESEYLFDDRFMEKVEDCEENWDFDEDFIDFLISQVE